MSYSQDSRRGKLVGSGGLQSCNHAWRTTRTHTGDYTIHYLYDDTTIQLDPIICTDRVAVPKALLRCMGAL